MNKADFLPILCKIFLLVVTVLIVNNTILPIPLANVYIFTKIFYIGLIWLTSVMGVLSALHIYNQCINDNEFSTAKKIIEKWKKEKHAYYLQIVLSVLLLLSSVMIGDYVLAFSVVAGLGFRRLVVYIVQQTKPKE
jgi:hypothetical protein